MNVEAFAEYIAGDSVQLVDVRTAEEFADGHINGATNIDVKDSCFIAKAKNILTTERPVAVYCRSGKRSAYAAEILSAAGYKAANLEGGILEWMKKKETTR